MMARNERRARRRRINKHQTSGFRWSWRRRASLNEQQSQQQQQLRPSTTHQLHLSILRHSFTASPFSLPPGLQFTATKRHSPHQSVHIHSRRHGFGGNNDSVSRPLISVLRLPVLTSFSASTTARAVVTATMYLHDGTPKQTQPTSSSNTRPKPTPNLLSAS